MAEDAIPRLIEALDANEAFREELMAAKSLEEVSALAISRGWAVTEEDLLALAHKFRMPQGELAESELQNVSGGSKIQRFYELISKILANAQETKKTVVSNLRA